MALRRYLVDEVALDCAAGLLSRREALRRLGLLGVGAATASTLLVGCGDDSDSDEAAPTSASSASPSAATSPESSGPAAVGEEIRFAGRRGELIGVAAMAPTATGAVLVIHENQGLTEHVRSLPGRLAADGHTALAVDLLSEEGGTAGLPGPGDATAALGAAPVERLVEDLRSGLDELERRAPDARLAAIGFCFGGGMTWQLLAAGEPRLAAAAPFYGPFPEGADLAGSPNAAVLGVYAEHDGRVNASLPAAEAALQAADLTHELLVVDGVDHAFFNDTGPRYDAEAAALAYAALLDWFATHLA